MTKKNLIVQDPIGDGVGARKLKVRLSLSRTGHVGDGAFISRKRTLFKLCAPTKLRR